MTAEEFQSEGDAAAAELKHFATCDLVFELERREGVETHVAEPYQDLAVSVNGPAIVLVVTD